MTVVIVFLFGALVGVLLVAFVVFVAEASANRKLVRRMGYVDLTITSREGRDASARPYDADELSGGPSSRPPTHLRIVKGERE